MVRIFFCCIMDCDLWFCVSSYDVEFVRNFRNEFINLKFFFSKLEDIYRINDKLFNIY